MVSGLVFSLDGPVSAKSSLIGGLVGFLPNVYFAIKFGRLDPKKSANEIVKSFYLGEATKLITTSLLFILVFQLPGIAFVPLFVGFVSVIMVFWFALLIT
jgi:ATP synthase protein I